MHYEKPDFVEIKMDAEVGSYQNDFDPTRDPSFVEPSRSSAVGAVSEVLASEV